MYNAKRSVVMQVFLQSKNRAKSMVASCPNIVNIATGLNKGQMGLMETTVQEDSLPFSKMPCLKGFVKNWVEFLWKGGAENYHEIGWQRFKRFGPVFKETIFGQTIVHLNDPIDIEKVFRCTEKISNRGPTLFPIVQYNRRTGYKDGLPGDGESWYDHRIAVSKKMLRPSEVREYIEQFTEVADDSIALLEQCGTNHGVRKITNDVLMRWATESVGTVLFGYRLRVNDLRPNERALEFLANLRTSLEKHGKMVLLYPFYQSFDTRAWRVYRRAMDIIYDHTRHFIDRSIKERLNSRGCDATSVLEHLLDGKMLPPRDIEQNLIYLFFSGVDTTSTTLLWLLDLLSKNPQVQNKLSCEIQSVLQGGKPSPRSFDKMPYLKACVKETLRLYPITVGTTRILDKPVRVGGYDVPAGTAFYLWNFANGRNAKFFEEPDEFKPERWLRNEEMSKIGHPFASLPFGFGSRACPGKRIAESEMYVFMSRLVQKYEVVSSKTADNSPAYHLFLLAKKSFEFQLRERE